MSTLAPRVHGGFHSVLETAHPYIFVDSCMQIWPDADFPRAHLHGVTAYAVTAWRPRENLATALEELMFWHLVARRHPNLLVAETAADITRAKREGRAALILASQGGEWIEAKLHRVEAFQRLGLRMMILAYNATNLLCDGTLDCTAGGLTRFGRLVVEECNRVGIVLDCTHIGKRSTLEIIDGSAHPCVFSHSNPSALAPNPRNIDDEQIRACVARDGVIGLAPWGPLVQRPGSRRRPSLDDFIDMIDHVADLAGDTGHIGIGTDMSLGTYPPHEHDPWGDPGFVNVSDEYGRTVTPDIRSPLRQVEGFDDYPQVVALADRLLARGYDDSAVRQILGENYLRLFGQVWKPSGALGDVAAPPARAGRIDGAGV
jgi:membrane dipeptidase